MKLKRWISMLLTLTLCLGLLPSAALATEEGVAETNVTESSGTAPEGGTTTGTGDSTDSGIGGENEGNDSNQSSILPDGYTQMYVSSDKTGSNPEIKTTLRAGSDSPQYFFIDSTDEAKVYLPTDIAEKAATFEFSCTDGLGRLFWDENNDQFGWTAAEGVPGTSGYLYVEVTLDGQTSKYAIAAEVTVPVVGAYTNSNATGYIVKTDGVTGVDSAEIQTVYLCIDSSFDRQFVAESVSDDSDVVTVTYLSEKTLQVTLAEGQTGTVNVLITCPVKSADGTQSENWDYRIIFTDGIDTGSGGNQGNTDNTIQAAPLTDAQKWPGIVSQALNPQMGPDEFIYDGQRYLIGFGGEQPSFFSDGTKDWDAVDGNGYFIHIWTQDQQGSYHRVGSELEATLLSKFENLTYTLYGAQWGDSLDSVRLNYPAYYPAYRADEYGMSYTFTNQNSGCWIMELTGKIGEQTVQALVRDIIEFIPTYTYEAASIEAANTYIVNTLAPIETAKANYTIKLPATALYGTIVIDNLKARLPITIQGTTGDDGTHTVLYGGIYANGGGNIYLKNLELVGAGKDKPSWGENSYAIDASTPNKGLYGQTTTNYTDCIFRDYYIAVECTAGLRWGGRNTQFLNNRIGVYLNRNYANGGATQMDQFLFKGNDVAILFREWGTSSVLPMSAYQIRNTKFIGNGKDIVNLTRKWFFLPGNYFVKDVGPVFSAKDPFGPMTLAEEEVTFVSAFPYATNENFDDFVYDAKAVISNSLAKDWLIPESDLSGSSITVIDDASNETAAVWSFGT